MPTNMDDVRAITQAVRKEGLKAIIEPSSNSPLDQDIAHLRELVRQGVLGDILWYSLGATAPTSYGPALGSNPYGQAAFTPEIVVGFSLICPMHLPILCRCWGYARA